MTLTGEAVLTTLGTGGKMAAEESGYDPAADEVLLVLGPVAENMIADVRSYKSGPPRVAIVRNRKKGARIVGKMTLAAFIGVQSAVRVLKKDDAERWKELCALALDDGGDE